MFALSTDNQRIAYEVAGHGRPVVLLHGFGDSRRSWREAGHVGALSAAGCRAILIDAIGHGESDRPHDPALYSARRSAADVVAVLDELDIDRADLIGFSMGGGTALATAVFHPERVGSLAMIGAHCFAQDMSLFRTALASGLDGLIRLIEAQGVALSEAARGRLWANDVEVLRLVVANDRPDRSALLRGLERPLIAIAGSEDPALAAIRRMAELAKGRFVELEGRNHFTSFLAAEQIGNAARGFFDARRAPAVAGSGRV